MKTTEPQTGEYWKTRPLNDADRDWKYGEGDWVKDYWASRNHPHRKHMLEAIKELDPKEVAEVGCNCGPNLSLIHENFPHIDLYGMDASPDAISFGKKMLCKHVNLVDGDFAYLPWRNNTMDVVIADASLMYAKPDDIEEVVSGLVRVAVKAVIIVDRCSDESVVTGAVWAHPYEKILKGMGLKTKIKKFTKEDWPESKNWQLFGQVIVATK
ncbi:MAG: class I SAM-dependent methyltransferase [Minisyncoccia bacterium]